jgi:hypothetical protein
MTSFAHVDQPSQHPGVVRAERVANSIRHAVNNFDATRSGASMLLAAIVSAFLVVANQVVETWTEGHLLVAWIVLWLVAFAAMGLLARPAKRAAAGMRIGLQRWSVARRQAAQDRELWNLALTDSRVMADISRAMAMDADQPVRAARYY